MNNFSSKLARPFFKFFAELFMIHNILALILGILGTYNFKYFIELSYVHADVYVYIHAYGDGHGK